jgi:hypothetical protein
MKNIFISHSWRYKDDYEIIFNWLKEELNFYDYSIPKHDNCGENLPNYKLKECIKNQIRYSSIVIIIGGMYASYSDWIDFEINTAHEMNKCIILIKPRGNERLPINAQSKADIIIGWNKNSLIKAIKECN